MPAYVALLRAVNVGGTGKLPMADLKAMCVEAGFDQVQTYIASGNVVFTHPGDAGAVKTALEARLQAYAGKPVGVLVRTAAEMAEVLRANPFPDVAPNRAVAIFLDQPPPDDAVSGARHCRNERIVAGAREIYVAYDDGMAASKLVIPAGRDGTARNMNSVAKLAELAACLA